MSARYYDPATGRFLSQDTYSGNVFDPWTQHLYSYCGNNPVNMVDPTGHSAQRIKELQDELDRANSKYYWTLGAEEWRFAGYEGKQAAIAEARKARAVAQFNLDAYMAVVDPLENAVNSVIESDFVQNIVNSDFVQNIVNSDFVQEIVNLDLNNTDPNAVLEACFVSGYKGKLVIKHSLSDQFGEEVTSCGIFGTIFLNNDVNDVDTVNHEYGHLLQEEMLGALTYIKYIAIPSLTHRTKNTTVYYNYPWERSADILAGVTRNEHIPEYESAANYYLIGAAYLGEKNGWR